MTETNVHYHGDGPWAEARPAINVKCHGAGRDYWPDPLSTLDGQRIGSRPAVDFVTEAYDRIVEAFWQDAEIMAQESGLGPIEQQGRSGGWLVFTDGRDPQDPGTLTEADTLHGAPFSVKDWLAAYRSMVEWADAYIADAPRKVAALAQQMAMDELGEEPARRFFSFDRPAGRADRYGWA